MHHAKTDDRFPPQRRRRLAGGAQVRGVGAAFADFVHDATGSLAMPSLVAVAALLVAAVLSVVADVERRGRS